MDEERRALVRRLTADPYDPVAGPALARILSRAPAPAAEMPSPSELVPGRAVLIVRASMPRVAFAWRAIMDRAIGRVGWVRSAAADGLSWEIDVPDLGRFHVGLTSLAVLPELGRRQASGTFNALDGSVGPQRGGGSIGDLHRLAAGRIEDEPGALGGDGLTHAQRLLLAHVTDHEGRAIEEVARAAGFSAENNRHPESAAVVLYNMAEQNPRVRRPLVTLESAVLLAGAVVPGPLDSGFWAITDLLVARVPGATALLEGLPWAVVNGIQTSAIHSPPHEPGEVADALVALLQNPRAGLDEIATIEGPDFPGGGEVGSRGDIGRFYATGAGTLRLRAAIEKQLPARLLVTTPWPEDAPDTLKRVVKEAVAAGRLDGVGEVSESGPLRVDLERGVEAGRLEAVKAALQELLPSETEVQYRLPAPLVWWLRTFLDEQRRSGLSDAEIQRRVLEAKRVANAGKRRTHVF